ncbi:hypothetical protein Ae201684P_008492 [Aphanomyces euteiches]|nr:hypothetical protein Ae201684P_008492 [Aphanomyces euteiches]
MNDFKMDRCISSWKLYTERTHQLNVLNQRALDFLDQKRRARCFDAWVLHGYVIKEQELKLQLAIDHSNASILRRRFCQWTEFAYWKYQTAQAKYHYHQTLLQQSWIAWLAFLQSRICDEASIELAEIHYREKLRSTAWRKWRLICMHQLQKRIAAHHFANHTLRKAFHEWREHGKVLCRLRHAWIYWEESALGLRFRQWQRFVESCRTRHAQFRLFQSVQQRQAVRRWHRWVEASKHSKQQLSWAASLFYESSLGWYFRAWRSKFVSRVHKRVQTERAISHLMCKGLRGFFERWKSAKVQMKHHREAKTMADYHLELTRQAKGVRYLHDRVVDLRAAQYIWEYVKAFRRHKLYLNGISAWRACAKERKVNKVMECTASRTFDMRILKKTFSHWIMYCSNVRYLKTRVYQSRHVYFSSLSSRAFLRLKRFARLKRQLRSISTRVQLRQRQEWFKRDIVSTLKLQENESHELPCFTDDHISNAYLITGKAWHASVGCVPA